MGPTGMCVLFHQKFSGVARFEELLRARCDAYPDARLINALWPRVEAQLYKELSAYYREVYDLSETLF